jgi:transcription elongation factor Elf1
MGDISRTKQYKGRRRTCLYRDREIVIVTCPSCGKPRLVQYRPHWKNKIPELNCGHCAQDQATRIRKFHGAGEKLHDFEDMLNVLEIVQANYTETTPRMVRVTVDSMLKAYRRNTAG